MNKNEMLRAMNLIEDEFVAEAAPGRVKEHAENEYAVKERTPEITLGSRKRQEGSRSRKNSPEKRNKRMWSWIGCGVTGLAVAVAAMWLFMPFNRNLPGMERYAGSEYYEIIQKLNEVTYRPPSYGNNFEKYIRGPVKNSIDDFLYLQKGEVEAPTANEPASADGALNSGSNESLTYEEITDNQVDGVIEADRIKRSDRYIYYLYGDTLRVYSIEGEASKEVGAYTFTADSGMRVAHTKEWEFYLSKDCRTVLMVGSFADDNLKASVGLLTLDVSDPAEIKEIGRITVTGNYLSSRYTGEEFLLMTEFRVKNNPDFSKEENYLPQIDTGNGSVSIAAEDIIVPETMTTSNYTVVCKLDGETFELEDSGAFLSYSEDFYVSREQIYATRGITEVVETDQSGKRKSMTEITGMSYGGEGLERTGTITVDGYVKDQYSLDEHDGVLRVVTTTSEMAYQINTRDGMIISMSSSGDNTSANLYCIDLEDWQIAAKVVGFAPKGETVRSVRFDGETAYVCTAVQVTDPVFFFDLSDIQNITYKETGNIEGFSTSLIDLGDGYLLGIGVGANMSTLKLEVYEEAETGVVSVCKYELDNVNYSQDYKAYYVNRDMQMIGLGIDRYLYKEGDASQERARYLVVFFDGYELRELLEVPLPGDVDLKRAVYIDGYFYLFGDDAFVVEKIGG